MTQQASANLTASNAERLGDILGAMRRQYRLALAIAIALSLAGTAYILRMPNVYQATTRILVNPQRVSDKYVSSTVSMDAGERLNTLSQQVLSSTRLQAIIDAQHLYPQLHNRLGREQLLEAMRQHIAIELKQSADGPSSFSITFTGGSAHEVAAVTNQLASSFIHANLHDREQEAEGTTAFLARQLAETKAQLDELEQQLRNYKLQHLGELPDQLDANMQTLSRLQLELQANVDAQNRLDHEAFLANAESTGTAYLPGSASVHVGSPLQQLQARVAQAHHELAELRDRYTAAYPDVIAKQAEVKALDAQLAREALTRQADAGNDAADTKATTAASATAPVTDPRLKLLTRDRARAAREQLGIEAQINTIQARVNAAPVREQELSQLLRDYDTAKEHYRSLLEKSYSADMATELERRQEGGSFTMLDPARVPDQPVGPNRPALLAGCLFFSLILGSAAGALRELMDGSVRSESDLHTLLPSIPLLGATPLRPASPLGFAAAIRRYLSQLSSQIRAHTPHPGQESHP